MSVPKIDFQVIRRPRTPDEIPTHYNEILRFTTGPDLLTWEHLGSKIFYAWGVPEACQFYFHQDGLFSFQHPLTVVLEALSEKTLYLIDNTSSDGRIPSLSRTIGSYPDGFLQRFSDQFHSHVVNGPDIPIRRLTNQGDERITFRVTNMEGHEMIYEFPTQVSSMETLWERLVNDFALENLNGTLLYHRDRRVRTPPTTLRWLMDNGKRDLYLVSVRIQWEPRIQIDLENLIQVNSPYPPA